MIQLSHVCKRYTRNDHPGPWVLEDMTLTIPAGVSVAVLGERRSGKSTLMRLLIGLDQPTHGEIENSGRVSYPAKFLRHLQPLLTGRQNARFISRIHGLEQRTNERIRRLEELSGLGATFDCPVKTYKPRQRAKLAFLISWVLDYELYVADDFNFAAEYAFGSQHVAEQELASLRGRATLVTTAGGVFAQRQLGRFCSAAIRLEDGRATWFDRFEDAFLSPQRPAPEARKLPPESPALLAILSAVKKRQTFLGMLRSGLQGDTVDCKKFVLQQLLALGADIGIEWVERPAGATLPGLVPGMNPILRTIGTPVVIEYFDRKTQFGAEIGAEEARQNPLEV